MKNLLYDQNLCNALEKFDADLTEKAQSLGCPHCGGVLHRGDYPRKPRGIWEWDKRYSLCCSTQGCRKRVTPASVRFLGRKVYLAIIVVVVSAMMHCAKKKSVKKLQDELGIDRRTLSRWRTWWQEIFAQSTFWKAKRSFFSRPIKKSTMPFGLVKAFNAENSQGMKKLLLFLSPATTRTCQENLAM